MAPELNEEERRRAKPIPRQSMPHIEAAARRNNFAEVDLGFSMEMAQAEGQRCLHCGLCCRCGECARKCGPQAIDLTETERVRELDAGRSLWLPASTFSMPANIRSTDTADTGCHHQSAVRTHVQRLGPHRGAGGAAQRRPAPAERRVHSMRRFAGPGSRFRILLQSLLHDQRQTAADLQAPQPAGSGYCLLHRQPGGRQRL